MEKIAVVGFGFMGRVHYGNWKRIPGAKVVAICDANLAQLRDVSGGNIAGVDASTDFADVAVYDDVGKMLAAGGFDAVDVTLPTPLHPEVTVATLKAGFHVLCEKPMALDVASCDRMLAAAKRAGKVLLVGHCLRFWPEYVALKKLIDSRKYGQVVAADFSRVTPPPDGKGTNGWYFDKKKSGGCLLDLHIHDADMVRFLFGPPKGADAVTHRRQNGLLDHAQIRYAYPDKLVTATASWAVSKTHGFESSFRVVFENATVVCDGKRPEPFMVYPQKGKPYAPKVSARSGYEAEQCYFLDIVRGRAVKPVLTARDAREAVALVTSLT